MNAPRPIAALDSVWTEELTWMEVRDAIKAGKTTGLILTGGVESNGPHLATGKHNFVLKVMGEAIARKLGNALVAPILTLEPGRPDGDRVAPGSVVLSAGDLSRRAHRHGDEPEGHGLHQRHPDGRQRRQPGRDERGRGRRSTRSSRRSGTRFYFIPEYYDYSSVQKLIQSSGIPEQIEIGASQGSDGIHEEYGIDALMALYDPKTIRIDERTKANRATINGVSLLPMSKTLEMARKIVDLRTKLTVDAINKAMAK